MAGLVSLCYNSGMGFGVVVNLLVGVENLWC